MQTAVPKPKYKSGTRPISYVPTPENLEFLVDIHAKSEITSMQNFLNIIIANLRKKDFEKLELIANGYSLN